jgi:hypothetical protein
MPPRRRTALAPAQIAFRAAVIIGLGADFGNQALWSASSGMPFLRNLADLAQSPAFFQIGTSTILQNFSAKTALELAHGDWAAVATSLSDQAATSRPLPTSPTRSTHTCGPLALRLPLDPSTGTIGPL